MLFRALTLPLLAVSALAGEEQVDWSMVTRLRDEGLRHSEVMQTAHQLMDVIGPRLTGSPQLKRANEWTRDKLAEWGLDNAHLESWGPFGRGWSYSHCSVHMTGPHQVPLLAYPKAWTPGTQGAVRGSALRAKIESPDDFDKWRGKLKGKILLVDEPSELKPPEKSPFERKTDDDLEKMAQYDIPSDRAGGGARDGDWRERALKRFKNASQVNEFLVSEGVVAMVSVSGRDSGMARVGGGGSYRVGENPGVPDLVMMPEHYNWITRLMKDEIEVQLEIEITAQFHDEDPMAYNTVAEIRGTDKANEIVMLGAHLDSWHSGTGATDNGAGSVCAMEAMRILKAVGVNPRRTIRIGLWSGEEEGLLGSRGYVSEHFAARPEPDDPEQKKLPSYLRADQGPLQVKPEHATFSVYFNLDNGSGKIRGVYTQENAAVVPIFRAWLEPFKDLGADTITMNNTGGTDHQSFDRVGLPGFQFIQDQLDYETRTHHTNLDVYDRLQRNDLMQASVIMASFAYHAAMREAQFPRKPMPKDEPPAKKDEKKPAATPAATPSSSSQ